MLLDPYLCLSLHTGSSHRVGNRKYQSNQRLFSSILLSQVQKSWRKDPLLLWFGSEISPKGSGVEGLVSDGAMFRGGAFESDWMMRALTSSMD
jgi:hypothetical protein